MKNKIRLTESMLHRVIKESVHKILRESEEEYPYYVAADCDSEYFQNEDEAYDYALNLAEQERQKNPDSWEEIHVMDNINWQPLIIFNEKGIYNLENGAFQPWW